MQHQRSNDTCMPVSGIFRMQQEVCCQRSNNHGIEQIPRVGKRINGGTGNEEIPVGKRKYGRNV